MIGGHCIGLSLILVGLAATWTCGLAYADPPTSRPLMGPDEGIILMGAVSTADGGPVPGTMAVTATNEQKSIRAIAFPEPSGAFAFDQRLPAGTYSVEADLGRRASLSETVTLGKDGNPAAVIALTAREPAAPGERGIAVVGTVTHADSATPIPDARVEVTTRVAGEPQAEGSATVNKAGAFALNRRLRPGKYVIRASDDTGTIAQAQLVVPEGGGPPVIAAHLKAWSGSLAGRVLDADGRPVVGAEVQLWPFETLGAESSWVESFWCADTDGTGSYRMEHLPPGKYTVSVPAWMVRNPDPKRRTSVQAGGAAVDVGAGAVLRDLALRELAAYFTSTRPAEEATGSVSGKVVDADGKPCRGAIVELRTQGWEQTYGAMTDEGGVYRIEHVAAGQYIVYVIAKVNQPVPLAGGTILQLARVRVDVGAGPVTADVALRKLPAIPSDVRHQE